MLVADFVELGSIVAGGDGVEPPPAGNIGINADTGAFIQARLNGDVTEANGLNPMPVDGLDGSSDSPYIDSVFIMTTGIGQVINTAGVVFDFDAGDVAQGWEGILDGREPGGPDSLRFGPLGPYTSGLGIHAAQGITYDLDALRVRHGAERIRHFSALLGEAGDGVAPAGNVNAYVVLSSEEGVLKSATVRALTDEAVLVLLHIPEEAQYLTLATGAAGDGIGSDHGGFGLARLRGEPLEIASFSSLQITPPTVNLEIGESTALSVSAVSTETEGELAGATFRPDPSDVAFISSRPEVATVDERGVVQGVANGRATITATYRGQSVDVTVTVGLLLDLGEIVRGGDGTDSGLALGEGIDPRNGLFVIAGLDGAINETNPEADGVNPSPVVDSPFVDSVFFIGPAVDPLAAT
ncbi:MAG TPA: NPCBM/NEW2 domain-containing protein, partial [Planctomycetota bacterium]|nr:NPCBM/NEW2 domain-containing protein [Planctomycetota bacterium]